jgi:hypothetical protein
MLRKGQIGPRKGLDPFKVKFKTQKAIWRHREKPATYKPRKEATEDLKLLAPRLVRK